MSDPAPSTRDRILKAALLAFARDGIQGATTRTIAQEAGVNEVTLFRHFQNKEGLLAAVMVHVVQSRHQDASGDDAEWTGDLKQNLQRFAEDLYAKLVGDEPFLRTMIGEGRRHQDHAKTVIMDAVKPVRDRFIANLETARKAGLVRGDLDLGIASDAFTAMLFGGMLRSTGGCSWGYEAPQFVSTCVDVFAAGLAPAAER
ncbi:MAG: transcriptional regulator, TetR family [Verrucomicrobiaceae bacterium]|nr:transcriptional regulator, TetR family [Verrucomicrobiaceae bacterium]